MTTTLQAPAVLDTTAGQMPGPSPLLDAIDRDDAAVREGGEAAVGLLAMSPAEHAAGVESLDGLLFDLRELVREFADLDALFGGGGDELPTIADARRKQHRQLRMQALRDQQYEQHLAKHTGADVLPAFKEPSESALERMANADAEHLQFCNGLEAQRTRWVRLRFAIAETEIRIAERARLLDRHLHAGRPR